MTTQELDRVQTMVNDALTAMELVPETTTKEIMMAAYTIAMRVTRAALEKHPDYRTLAQQSLEVVMLECSGGRPN